MAQQQRYERQLQALRNDRELARFVVEGRAAGKQLGTGSYGSVEEVKKIIIIDLVYITYMCKRVGIV